MIFGRRPYKTDRRFAQQRGLFSHPLFQRKYVYYLVLTMTGLALFFYGPALYFVSQNYQLMTSLAYETHPSLVSHLERETQWIWLFAGGSVLGIIGLTFWIAITLTQHLIEPVIAIEKHMRDLVMGRWDVPDFNPEYAEFKELALTYEYLFRSLKTMTEEELKLLNLVVVDRNHKDAWGAWLYLVNMKRQRLGLGAFNPEIAVLTSEVDSERLVS